MTRRLLPAAFVLFLLPLLAVPGCGRDSSAFVLPAGDPAAGRETFVELQCNGCHTVAGVDMAVPVADPPVGVDLAVVSRRRTDSELAMAIIDPDHALATRFASGVMDVRGHSRMGDYSDVMSVRQLIDVVAFLKAHEQLPEPMVTP